MSDICRQAATTLLVYLERGRLALDLLEKGEIDRAEEVLKLRGAAFHNFRALDALAQKAGQDISQAPECLTTWHAIREVEILLTDSLASAHQETGRLYARVKKARQKIGRYRSRAPDSSRFAQTI